MITTHNIHKHFGNLHVLKGVDIEINKGEIIAIVGPSGAGKTSLLQILGTLSEPDDLPKSTITVAHTELNDMTDKSMAIFRNTQIGFIFQFHQLLPEFTALENVCIPAFIAGKSKKEAEDKASELLDYLGLSDRKNHKPQELSGGEQ